MNLEVIIHHPLFGKSAATVTLLIGVLALRALFAHVITRQGASPELRRRWLVASHNWIAVLFLLGFGAIWAEAVRSFAISIVAVAVAVVIAVKELIQCFSGSIIRTTSGAYSVGDRIELDGHRGDVIDLTLLTTTILEVGPGQATHMRTGRTIVIPNSKLMDSVLINESYMQGYVLHVFTVPLKAEDDWETAERILLEAARREAIPHMEEVRRRLAALERSYSLSGLPMEPSALVQVPEVGKLSLVVRVPAPVGRQGATQQAILRKFLAGFQPAKSSPS